MGKPDILPDGIRMEHPSSHGMPPDAKQVDELFEVYFNETFPNDWDKPEVKAEYRRFIGNDSPF